MLKTGKKQYPIIVGGFYRSGTTLLRRIIDSHSNIHCPPEIKFFKDFYGDYLEDDLKHIRFFSTVRSFGLSEADLLKIFGKAFIKAHEVAANKCNKRRWADKNPENLLYLDEWYDLLNGKMFFIFICRNPLDAISSLVEIGFPKTVPQSFEEKVDMCYHFLRKALVFTNEHPDISYTIKYEDLIERPKVELINLCNFIGERFEEKVLTDFISDERGRGIEDPKIYSEKNIHQRSINRWHKDLTKKQFDLIMNKCSDFMEKLSYSNCHKNLLRENPKKQ